jgi:hypothetical protein
VESGSCTVPWDSLDAASAGRVQPSNTLLAHSTVRICDIRSRILRLLKQAFSAAYYAVYLSSKSL